jgi:hypothetical protein
MAESDDLIIDLTDLMEEEVSEKKGTANVSDDKPLKLETDTFDLGKELTLDDSPVNTSDDKFDFDKVFKESLNGIASVINPEPKPEQPPEMQSEEMPFDDASFDKVTENKYQASEPNAVSFEPEKPLSLNAVDMPAVAETFKSQLPEMAEAIIRPLINELMNEVIAIIKNDLPGIVEKVLREEIDKLKKID